LYIVITLFFHKTDRPVDKKQRQHRHPAYFFNDANDPAFWFFSHRNLPSIYFIVFIYDLFVYNYIDGRPFVNLFCHTGILRQRPKKRLAIQKLPVCFWGGERKILFSAGLKIHEKEAFPGGTPLFAARSGALCPLLKAGSPRQRNGKRRPLPGRAFDFDLSLVSSTIAFVMVSPQPQATGLPAARTVRL
jgi:hypothetical protein